MTNKIHLPVVESEQPQEDSSNQPEKTKLVFPTGKPHISYSELHDWMECSWRHKLKHIDKLDLDGPTIHTEFGQVVHDAMETYLMLPKIERKPINASIYQKMFKDKFDALDISHESADKQAELLKQFAEFNDKIVALLEDAPKWMDIQFPDWETVAAEDLLYEPIPNQEDIKFKGFVDAFIKVPKRRKVRKPKKSSGGGGLSLSKILDAEEASEYEIVPGEFEHFVLDWKTTSWGWTADKKRDFNKQLQIMLYKIFYCQKMNLDLKEIKCGFVLLKRDPNKEGSYCEFVPVSVGEKSMERALSVVNSMVNQVKQGRTMKNRWSCRFCKFANTKHCM